MSQMDVRNFVPKLLIKQISASVMAGEISLQQAKSIPFHGIYMIINMEGISNMPEMQRSADQNGIHGIKLCSQTYTGKLVDCVLNHGGDVVKFTPQALHCVFAKDINNFVMTPKKGTGVLNDIDILLTAMLCAKELAQQCNPKFKINVVLSYGEMCFGILGGVENRWECLISGPCIHQLSGCLDDAPSMAAAMTTECLEILQNHAVLSTDLTNETSVKDNKTTSMQNWAITTEQGRFDIKLQTLSSTAVSILDVNLHIATSDKTMHAVAVANVEETMVDALLTQFFPISVADLCTDTFTVCEVATMYMQWDSYDAHGKHRDLLELQRCFFAAQKILHSTGAYLRQFLMDDKGCVLIACWGMPNMSYVDNCHRALSSAVQIRTELDKLGMQTSVGITCSDVYCGAVGSSRRMEYAAIGSAVNMAARIMTKAKGRLLLDDTAFQHLPLTDRDNLTRIVAGTETLLSVPVYMYCDNSSVQDTIHHHVKNVTDMTVLSPVCESVLDKLFHRLTTSVTDSAPNSPLCKKLPLSLPTSGKSVTSKSFFGLDLSVPAAALSAALSYRSVSCSTTTGIPIVLLHGPVGTGKSSTVSALCHRGNLQNVRTIHIRLNSRPEGVRSSSYTLWQKVFTQLLHTCLRTTEVVTETDIQHKGSVSHSDKWCNMHTLLHNIYPNLTTLTDKVNLSTLSMVLGIDISLTSQNSEQSLLQQDAPVLCASRKPILPTENAHLRDVLVTIFTYLLTKYYVLLVVENIHSADEASLEVLNRLLPRLTLPCGVFLTAVEVDVVPAAVTPTNSTTSTSTGNNSVHHVRVRGDLWAFDSSLLDKITTLQTEMCLQTPWYRMYKDIILQYRGVTAVLLPTCLSEEDIALMLQTVLQDTVLSVPVTTIVGLVWSSSRGTYFWVREMVLFIAEHGAQAFMDLICIPACDPVCDPAGVSAVGKAGTYTGSPNRRASVNLAAPLQNDAVLARQILSMPSFRNPDMHRGQSATTAATTASLPTTTTTIHPSTHRNNHQLHAFISQRVSKLPQQLHTILSVASIIGHKFSAEVLFAVLSSMPHEDLQASLRELIQHRWISQDPDSTIQYNFIHTYIHHIVYEQTLYQQRMVWYKQIAAYVVQEHGHSPVQFCALSRYYLHSDMNLALQYAAKALPVLLDAVYSVFDFVDALDLLASVFPACHRVYDVDVLVKLVEQCQRRIERYGRNGTTTASRQNSSIHRTNSSNSISLRGSISTLTSYVSGLLSRPSSNKIVPVTGGSLRSLTPKQKYTIAHQQLRPQHSVDTLLNPEISVRALFVRHCERLSSQLSAMYIEIAEAGPFGEPADWQRKFLNI